MPTLLSSSNPVRSEVPPLYPVVLRVPVWVKSLRGATAAKALGGLARQALRISGERSGCYPQLLLKGNAGQPLACRGVHWSITHKPGFVAGVVASEPAGIDIERLKPVSDALFKRIVSRQEFDCFGTHDRTEVFFRTFTAKEAVLKVQGVGISGLSRVKVTGAPQTGTTLVAHETKIYTVDHFWVDGHLASVVKDRAGVVWECVDPV